MPRVDIVIPVFNEAEGLASLHASLIAALAGLAYDFRILYVDDGSGDETQAVLKSLASSDSRVQFLGLSRNFGHQAALTAGLDHADADIVIMMDGDGQHPPDLIPEMLRLHQLGYDIVQTQRVDSGSSLKVSTARGFYWILNRIGELNISPGAADFRLVSREVLDSLRQLNEYHRFLRGLFSWMGFKSVLLPYTPRMRLAGTSKYSMAKMLRLARDGLFSFSLVPLRLAFYVGFAFLVFAVFEVAYVLSLWIAGDFRRLVPGWSSIIIILTVSSGLTMVLLGFIGIYVGMIFQEVKRRPAYLVKVANSSLLESRLRQAYHGVSER
jgi:glycosyltransferase involved in cell wall biosynthesis